MNQDYRLITKNITNFNSDELLRTWYWLVDEKATILFSSLFGDLSLQYPDQSVYWLDTGLGELTLLAATPVEFFALLEQPENVSYWLLPDLANEALEASLALGALEVYSFRMLPLIGGQYLPNNLQPTNLQTHLNLTGELHEQLNKLLDGTEVLFKVTD